MMFFALLGSICFLKMYQGYENRKIRFGWWLGAAILIFFSTWSKPGFTINMIFAVVLMFIVDLIRGNKKNIGQRFVKLFIIGCSLIPSGLYILWLHNASFTEGTQYGEEHAVLIDFAHVLEYDNLIGAIIFGCAIPIIVYAFNVRRFSDKKYKFALYVFAMGMLQWALFTETGKRGNYGNFTWGRTYGIYFLTLTAAVVFIEVLFDKKGKYAKDKGKRIAFLVLSGIVIVWAIISQLNYFRLVLTGHGYQL
jgi:low affinity Fe/Cu permease